MKVLPKGIFGAGFIKAATKQAYCQLGKFRTFCFCKKYGKKQP